MRELIQALLDSGSTEGCDGLVVVGEEEFDTLKTAFEDEEKAIGMKEEILKAIDKAKLSILRGMHVGDKVANTLAKLVDRLAALGLACHKGEPVSVQEIFMWDEWLEAEAYVLRINTIRDSKEKR